MKERFKKIRMDGTINVNMDSKKGVWTADKRTVINMMRLVCEEYQRDNYTLTLRQLYYQLVSRDVIPNHDKVYKKISSLKDDAVYGGLIDWNIFEDRGRVPSVPYHVDGIEHALERAASWHTLDRQENQNNHIEVWTEKDAISSILKRVTSPFGVTLVVNKGYTSSTAIYGAYKRFSEAINHGQKIKILYFGDHDPSGLDMIRDINDRLMMMFIRGADEDILNDAFGHWKEKAYSVYDVLNLNDRYEKVGSLMEGNDSDEVYELFEQGQKELYLKDKGFFEIIQVGLTMDQINEFNPPPNPAKMTDPRMKGYVAKFGRVSWEVDALKPKVMERIVKSAIISQMNMDMYDAILKIEKEEKKIIRGFSDKINEEE